MNNVREFEERLDNWAATFDLLWKNRDDIKTSETVLRMIVVTPVSLFIGLTWILIAIVCYAFSYLLELVGVRTMLFVDIAWSLVFPLLTLLEDVNVFSYKMIRKNLSETRKKLIENKFEESGIAY